MTKNNILIILTYYNRPRIVHNALYSLILANQNYGNWRLAFIDDGSPEPGRPIVESILKRHLDKVTFYGIPPEEKPLDGSRLGEFNNQAVADSDCDLCFTLCDDDALHPFYLANLNDYFNKNPKVNSCYSNLVIFDPNIETFLDAMGRDIGWSHGWNQRKGPMNGAGILDGSQMAWRMFCNKEKKCSFVPKAYRSQDYWFYKELFEKCGPTHYTGFVSQFKGVFAQNLSSLWGWSNISNDIERFKWTIKNSHILDQSKVSPTSFRKYFLKLY